MAKTFRSFDRDQMLLMPPSLADGVPEDHLARFVGDLVETRDLRAIKETYTEERGYPPYHPRMRVALLLYGYCTGTYLSRKIAANWWIAWRSGIWRRATSRTSGRSARFASDTARRWRRCSRRACGCVGRPAW